MRCFFNFFTRPGRRALRPKSDAAPEDTVTNRIRILHSFSKQRHPIAPRAMQCFRTSDENINLRIHSIAPLAISGLHNAIRRESRIIWYWLACLRLNYAVKLSVVDFLSEKAARR